MSSALVPAHMCPAEEHQYGEERGDPSSLDLAYVRASAGGGAGTWAPSKLDLVLRSTRRAFGDPVFFTFPKERPLEHRATDRRVGADLLVRLSLGLSVAARSQ